MNTTDLMDRLTQARPALAERTEQVVGARERDELLASLLADEASVAVGHDRDRSRGRGRSRRRRVAAASLAPVLTAAAVVGLLWAGLPSSSSNSPHSTTSGSAAAPVGEPPLVLERVRLAMAGAADDVLHVVGDFGNGVRWDSWHDPVNRRERFRSSTLAGVPIYDHELTAQGDHVVVRVVSFNDRAWWTYNTEPGRESEMTFTGGPTAADIRAQLDDGTLQEVAHETLDGRAVLRLRWLPPTKPGLITTPGDLWVDVATNLPVRSVSHQANKAQSDVRSDFEWLPRSAASEAQLAVAVPAGFVHLAEAPAATGEGVG
ncbi:MAG: hypothetical protein QOK43_3013 [Acidimicrobiaceae bacterium]|nr:hypothetical protein [Acidimicrobiaceae bacterium]